MSYEHLKLEKRYVLSHLKIHGLSIRERIAGSLPFMCSLCTPITKQLKPDHVTLTSRLFHGWITTLFPLDYSAHIINFLKS